LSWASLLSGNFEDAFKAASEALAQFPDKSWIKTNLITAAVLTGRTDEAKSRYAAAKEERIGDQTLTDVLLKDLADVAAAAKSDPRLDEFKTWLASN
jgi:thioredoxin-like negative regulator of GroEL